MTFVICKQDITPTERESQVPSALRDEMLKTGHEDWLSALDTCGINTKTIECCVCGDYRHPVQFHCKLRLCPDCTRKKAHEIREKFLPHLQELKHLKLITLTIKNTATIEEGIQKIRNGLKRLRQRKDIKSRLFGGVYSIETTVGRDGKFHVHCHLLVSMFFISQERLSDIWKDITGDPIVDIRKVIGGARRALRYVTEYLTKGLAHLLDKWEPAQVIEYLEATIKARLIAGIGKLYGVVIPREKLKCPHCGESIFRLSDLNGHIVFDSLELLRRRAWDSS